MAKGASNPTSTPEAETESCDICGKPGATVAYFATGMAAVVYRHHECAPRELSPSEERQAWHIDQMLGLER